MTFPDLSKSPDIQGIFFRGYKQLDGAAYGLFQVTDPVTFQDWLGHALANDQISSAAHGQPDHGNAKRMNIAFTALGLQTLLGAGYMPDDYDHAFTGSMITPERSRILGDLDANAPARWKWGGQNDMHGLLMCFAADLATAEADLRAALDASHGVQLCHVTSGRMAPNQREPFGFRDGIAQPVLDGTPRQKMLAQHRPKEAALMVVPPGELVLGYRDGTGRLPETPATSAGLDPDGILPPHPIRPERRDFGKNGSYLVFRQLAQHTDLFWDYVNRVATGTGEDTAQALAEKMVGRKMDGTPLAPEPDDGNNAFDFSDDVKGLHCPVGSHVRRSNNRAVNTKDPKLSLEVSMRHRILRRARVFEEDGEVGLQFFCFNASIVRQFEFIQSAWCNNPFFQGLQKEVDPIIGTPRAARLGVDQIDRFTIPRRPYRRVLEETPQFVTLRGGAYFFMPGLPALRFLAQAARAERGLKIPAEHDVPTLTP